MWSWTHTLNSKVMVTTLINDFVGVDDYLEIHVYVVFIFYTYYCGLKVIEGIKDHGPLYLVCGFELGRFISHFTCYSNIKTAIIEKILIILCGVHII